MRLDMPEAIAAGVAMGLRAYGETSRGGRGADRPPVAPVAAAVADHLRAEFVRTDSRAYLTAEVPYGRAVALAEGAEAAIAPVAARRPALIVWNHRDLPRGAIEILPAWEDPAVTEALAALDAFNRACGPDAGGTVRYGLLVVLSLGPLPPELPAGVRPVTAEPVPWADGRTAQAVVLELATADAPTPCQIDPEGH